MTLNFKVRKSPEFVFDCLSDPQKFVAVHPLIYKIELIEGTSYRVFERVKLGFITRSFTYKADIRSSDMMVHINAVVDRFTKVEMRFSIDASDEGAHVQEEIKIRSFLPIRGYMEGVFREQHATMFENIQSLQLYPISG